MKRLMVLFSVMALVLCFTASGFAGKENWPKAVAFGSGSVGGSAYPSCMAYANIVAKHLGVPSTCETSGGSINNTKLIHMKKLLMGHTAQGAAWNGFYGKEWAKGEKYNNLRAMFPLYPQLWHGFTLPKYNITKLADLNGKVVSGGPRAEPPMPTPSGFSRASTSSRPALFTQGSATSSGCCATGTCMPRFAPAGFPWAPPTR